SKGDAGGGAVARTGVPSCRILPVDSANQMFLYCSHEAAGGHAAGEPLLARGREAVHLARSGGRQGGLGGGLPAVPSPEAAVPLRPGRAPRPRFSGRAAGGAPALHGIARLWLGGSTCIPEGL